MYECDYCHDTGHVERETVSYEWGDLVYDFSAGVCDGCLGLFSFMGCLEEEPAEVALERQFMSNAEMETIRNERWNLVYDFSDGQCDGRIGVGSFLDGSTFEPAEVALERQFRISWENQPYVTVKNAG
jgi:hypothetical protein